MSHHPLGDRYSHLGHCQQRDLHGSATGLTATPFQVTTLASTGVYTSGGTAQAQIEQVWLRYPALGIAEPFTVPPQPTVYKLNTGKCNSTPSVHDAGQQPHRPGRQCSPTRSVSSQAFNSWLRQGPPGVLAVIDMDKVSKEQAQPVPVKNQMYYTASGTRSTQTPLPSSLPWPLSSG